jgi:hypothetical protein
MDPDPKRSMDPDPKSALLLQGQIAHIPYSKVLEEEEERGLIKDLKRHGRLAVAYSKNSVLKGTQRILSLLRTFRTKRYSNKKSEKCCSVSLRRVLALL